MLRNLLLTLACLVAISPLAAQNLSSPEANYALIKISGRGGDGAFDGSFHEVRQKLAQNPNVKSTSFLTLEGAFLVEVERDFQASTEFLQWRGISGVQSLTANQWQAKRREFLMQKLMANKDRKWQPTTDFPIYRNTGNAGFDEKIYTEAVLHWINANPEAYNRLF